MGSLTLSLIAVMVAMPVELKMGYLFSVYLLRGSRRFASQEGGQGEARVANDDVVIGFVIDPHPQVRFNPLLTDNGVNQQADDGQYRKA